MSAYLLCHPHPYWCLQVKRGVGRKSVASMREIHRATKSLKSFHVVSRVRFDDWESRPVRQQGQSALFGTSWWNSFPVFVTLGPV